MSLSKVVLLSVSQVPLLRPKMPSWILQGWIDVEWYFGSGMFCKGSCIIKLWSLAVRKWGLDGGHSVLGMCFEGNTGFLELSSPFASWSPRGEQLCSAMVFCLTIVQKQWRQITMDQNHNPTHIFPPLFWVYLATVMELWDHR